MNLDIFKITHNNIAPEAGKVLVSVPFINDNYFSQSVVLLVSHNKKGSIGYILNKQIPITLNDLLENIPHSNFSVGIGGPVANNTLNMLHTVGNLIPDCLEVMPGLYWGGNFDTVIKLLQSRTITPNEIRFFMGYSGWDANQLNSEITSNSWLVSSISTDQIITNSSDQLWKQTLKSMGNKYQVWSEFPLDPALN